MCYYYFLTRLVSHPNLQTLLIYYNKPKIGRLGDRKDARKGERKVDIKRKKAAKRENKRENRKKQKAVN